MEKRYIPVKSFTLIELMVVVIIVAILVGLTMPNFLKAREQAATKEALANLKLIAAAEKIYHVEYDVFWGLTGVGAINENLKLLIQPSGSPTPDYRVDNATESTFVARVRRGVGGPVWCMNASTVDEPYNAAIDPSCTW